MRSLRCISQRTALGAALLLLVCTLGPSATAQAGTYEKYGGEGSENVIEDIYVFPTTGNTPTLHSYSGHLAPEVTAVIVDLSHADLEYAELWSTILVSTDFSEAFLDDANFWGAILRSADFNAALGRGAIFQDADLDSATFIFSDMPDCYFTADLKDTKLGDADFTDANLSGCYFDTFDQFVVDATDTIFTRTDLSFSYFYTATATGADFTGADLSSSDIWDSDFSNTTLDEADFSQADLSGTDLAGASVEGTRFTGSQFGDPEGNTLGLESTSGSAYYDETTDFATTGFNPVAAGWIELAVPEPASASLQLAALLTLLGIRRRLRLHPRFENGYAS